MAPEGFHSVCGTESDQKVPPVQFSAAQGDQMAKVMLEKGDVFGKQFVVFLSYQAYPAYVVTYTYTDDFAASLTPTEKVIGSVNTYSQRSCIYVFMFTSIFDLCPRPQMPLKWEHKAKTETKWTEYSPKHSIQLSQANIWLCLQMSIFFLS